MFWDPLRAVTLQRCPRADGGARGQTVVPEVGDAPGGSSERSGAVPSLQGLAAGC